MQKPGSLLILLAAAFTFLGGCAPLPPVPPPGAPVQQCLVCRHKRDFSCLDVKVTSTTPRCECNGRSYYFCSEACRSEFEKRPEPFLPKS